MSGSLDPRLLEPFVLAGPAVERDRSVKDNNNAEKTNEENWLEAAERMDSDMSAAEVDFFAEMRRRQGQ
jgi:hypothetical protein